MPARAADNCVRVVASSLGSGYGIWDTTGCEATRARRAIHLPLQTPIRVQSCAHPEIQEG